MNILKIYQKWGSKTMQVCRWDLQLHFFWGFLLTLLGVYWPPLFASGILVTIIKEALDLWSKGHWSWGDVWWGIIGSVLSLLYVHTLSYL